MTCHNPKTSFTELPRSKRKDRNERRFICRECGQHWQYANGWYQVSVPKYGEVRKQYAFKLTPSQHARMIELYGSKQKYLDMCLERDGLL